MAKKWSAAAPCRSGYTPRCHGFASFVVAICVAVSLFRGGNVARGEEECGNCSPSRSPSAHDGQTSSDHGRNNDLEDHAFLLADYYKRLHRPELSLAGWQKDGFASDRAAEFEELRVNEHPCEFQIPHLDSRNLSTTEFREMYESQSRPVIVENIPETRRWPAATRWTLEGLENDYGEVEVKVAADDDDNDLHMPLAAFIRYARAQKDDSPLYVFDTNFVNHRRGRRMTREYSVPNLFPEDLFSCMEDQRPPFRWLLVGPKRSGTTVHLDPLGTSAWNTLLSGRKLWVLSPPGTLRTLERGRRPRGDIDNFEEPATQAINYFLDVLPRVREELKGMVEVTVLVQHPGETIFVPAGWVHGVLNLDDTVAITQNFVSSNNFDEVWTSVRRSRPTFGLRWLQRLLATHPELVQRALNLNERDDWDMLEGRHRGEKKGHDDQETLEDDQDNYDVGDDDDDYDYDDDDDYYDEYDDEYDEF